MTFNNLCIDDVTILHKSIYYGHMNIFSYHNIWTLDKIKTHFTMQYSHDFYTQRVNQLLVYDLLICVCLNLIITSSDKNLSFKIYISNSFHQIIVRENRRDNHKWHHVSKAAMEETWKKHAKIRISLKCSIVHCCVMEIWYVQFTTLKYNLFYLIVRIKGTIQ